MNVPTPLPIVPVQEPFIVFVFHIVILFCQIKFVFGKSRPLGPLTFNTPLPLTLFAYTWIFPTAGVAGSFVIVLI
jgi:hypothetical protein